MSTVVVEPDAFYDCAQSLSYGVHDVVSGALDTLVARLGGCGSMAGSDEGGVAWAGDYDDAVRVALSAGADLDTALYNVVCLLERTGLNHEQADAASTPGGTMPPEQRVHAVEGSFRLGTVPSAAGGSGSAPFGWSLVRHAVGYLWPNGHQDRLHDAAGAWDDAARSLRSAAHAIDPIWGRIAEQQTPEVYDAEVVLAGMQNHLHDLAGTFAGLARACRGLAHHIDQAHSDVENELISLTAQSAAVEVVGGVFAFFTAGAAEGPTQAVEASRIAAAASRISGYLSSFVSAVRSVVAAVPALGAHCARRLLGRRVAAQRPPRLRRGRRRPRPAHPPRRERRPRRLRSRPHRRQRHRRRSRRHLRRRSRSPRSRPHRRSRRRDPTSLAGSERASRGGSRSR